MVTDPNSWHDWFLTPEERGNPHTGIDRRRDDPSAWSVGNRVRVLVHGAAYFARLASLLDRLGEGDLVYLCDWRGDPDQELDGPGRELGPLLRRAAERGADIRGLLWRSHPDQFRLSEQEALHLAAVVNDAGAEILLDERVRRGGSHHQKLVIVRHRDNAADDVAFVGGIDLCHGRGDDERHLGDPQAVDLDDRYGRTPPWHDIQLEVTGPAVADLAYTFRERWEDPTPLDHRNPLRARLARRAKEPRRPQPLPPMVADPPGRGPHAVQTLRTYPMKRPSYPFAPEGERSIARAYSKAFTRARRLIYLEDQYLWSAHVAGALADALRDHRDLHLIAVVPRYPEQDGRISGPAERIGHQHATDVIRDAGGERVAIYDLENDVGTPVYVHAKVCVVDDVWAMIGSDNLNLRSWTHDSELSCAIVDSEPDSRPPVDPAGLGDGARRFARNLRLRLAAEHLDRPVDDPELLDPAEAFRVWRDTAAALDRWYEGGERGVRPRGRIRRHHPERVRWWAAWWAAPVYRLLVDPDGRPRGMRYSTTF